MYNYSIELKDLNENNYGINNIELTDGVFGKELADMTGNEVEDIRRNLIETRRKIVLYTVKTPLSDYDRFVLIFRKAHLLNIDNIRLTSDITDEFGEIAELARAMDIKVIFDITPEFGFDDYKKIRTKHTGILYDPCAFLKAELNPFLKVLTKSKVKDDIVFLRFNDGLMITAEPTLPEEGNAEVKECASNLIARSYSGYFSITDYLGGRTEEVLSHMAKALCEM